MSFPFSAKEYVYERLYDKRRFFEQTQGKINPTVVKYYYGPRVSKSSGSFEYLVTVMEAHVIMLVEQGIIPEEVAAKLLKVWRAGGMSSLN